MKIVHTPISDGNPYQRELADALRRMGHSVDLYTPVWPFPFVHYVLKNGKPDIFHIHWQDQFLIRKTIPGSLIRSILSVLEFMLIGVLGIKIVWTVHNVLNHERTHPAIEMFFLKIILKFFNEITFMSQAGIEAFNGIINPHKCVQDKFHIVPHGSYVDSYTNKISKPAARQILNIDEDSFIFLCFGEARPYKGLQTVIGLMKDIPDPSIRLLVAGRAHNKSFEHVIRKAASSDKRIHTVLSYIPDDFVQVFMNASDVVVLPYKDILNSGAAVLAMSFGKPVIAPNMGGIKDLLDGNGGMLFDPADKRSLIDAMLKMKNADVQAMGKHNHEKIRHYDWDYIATLTSAVYAKAMNASGRSGAHPQ
ncbi:MAG TPA: glycosyltransferase family 4 protein [Deltaproteobacteria bacterium]|nr:glycosyltransferase family 4 protein [Deltaproteobacteria bacterium]HPR53752.1 glycosyltransferase family 4 protein [Deltaproteobacteria bacterium]HXK46769.1 glycosyltransferase family 4 protein [Deltaproteobacteria bacterium]